MAGLSGEGGRRGGLVEVHVRDGVGAAIDVRFVVYARCLGGGERG